MTAFFSLLWVAIAISGFMAYVFFWPMALIHLRDRHLAVHAQLGPFAFAAPSAMAWLLAGRYRALGDRGLDGLATPARLSLITVIVGLALAAVLALISPDI